MQGVVTDTNFYGDYDFAVKNDQVYILESPSYRYLKFTGQNGQENTVFLTNLAQIEDTSWIDNMF